MQESKAPPQADDDDNEKDVKEQYRKAPNRCSKKFDNFADEFYDDGKDDYVPEKDDDMSEKSDDTSEVNNRKAMTLAMFIKPKNSKPAKKATHKVHIITWTLDTRH